MLIPKTHVLRDSAMCQVSAADLVPGDIISFSAGEKVPADIRILTADKLIIDESDVTGESNPKECNVSISNEKTMQACNMTWKGCIITDGSGSGIVVATGKETILGK